MTTQAKVSSYKGFKIQSGHFAAGEPELHKVFTAEEWSYGKGLRSYEWEACSLQEAKDFIDSY